MAKLANVHQLNHTNNEVLNPYSSIHTFLSRKKQNSLNTSQTYERHIRDFFRTMRNKELSNLVEEDLVFTKNQIESYQVALKENHKGSTTNNAISAIKECYAKFEDDGFNVKESWFKLDRYDEHDSDPYDAMTAEEVHQAMEVVSRTRKGDEKALIIRVAFATAFRQKSLLEAKWSDIILINDQWYLRVLGKGNKLRHKKLSEDLYKTLMKHKENSNSEKIFQLTKKTIGKMMNLIREEIDFGDRNIVFHSFKKASIREVNIMTNGDLKAMQAQGDHENVKTTLEDYIADKELDELVIVDINAHVPVEKFDEMTHQELLSLVKNMDRTTQVKLLKKHGSI